MVNPIISSPDMVRAFCRLQINKFCLKIICGFNNYRPKFAWVLQVKQIYVQIEVFILILSCLMIWSKVKKTILKTLNQIGVTSIIKGNLAAQRFTQPWTNLHIDVFYKLKDANILYWYTACTGCLFHSVCVAA